MKKLLEHLILVGAIVLSTNYLYAESNTPDPCSPGPIFDYVDKYLVRLEKSAPSMVQINEDFSYNYVVVAKNKIKKVVIEDTIPSGTNFVSSNPVAEVDGDKVTWTLYDLKKGDIRSLELVVNALQVAEFTNCATITAYPEACTTTAVGVPILAIEHIPSKPEVVINSELSWDIKVENKGNFCAYDVVVTSSLSDGISHESGDADLITEVGTLAPGEAREMIIFTSAAEAGEHCNLAVAQASNAKSVEADACVSILKSSIEVTTTGRAAQFVGKKLTYEITASNTGEVPLSDVLITYEVSPSVKLLEAPDAQIDGNNATWQIALEEQDEKNFEVTVLGIDEGSYCNEVSVSSVEYNLDDSDSVCTEWSGYPALLIEVIDTEDPLLIGEETTYIIQITNQGTAADTNIMLDVQLPDSLLFVSATGDTESSVDGNKITFDSYPVLNAKEIIQYRIVAKAMSEGDSRFRANMRSDLLIVPVPEEESTQVY